MAVIFILISLYYEIRNRLFLSLAFFIPTRKNSFGFTLFTTSIDYYWLDTRLYMGSNITKQNVC